MPEEKINKGVLVEGRKLCYKVRDEYFACVDANNGDASKCKKLKKAFEKGCPASWVTHFERKREELKKVQVYLNASPPNTPPPKPDDGK